MIGGMKFTRKVNLPSQTYRKKEPYSSLSSVGACMCTSEMKCTGKDYMYAHTYFLAVPCSPPHSTGFDPATTFSSAPNLATKAQIINFYTFFQCLKMCPVMP